MALFLPEWYTGEEEFRLFCDFYWYPHLTFSRSDDGYIHMRFHLFDEDAEEILPHLPPPVCKDEFLVRFNNSVQILVKRIGLDFKELSSSLDMNLSEESIAEANYNLIEKFAFYEGITDYPLYFNISNLVFFGSWDYVPHFKFIWR